MGVRSSIFSRLARQGRLINQSPFGSEWLIPPLSRQRRFRTPGPRRGRRGAKDRLPLAKVLILKAMELDQLFEYPPCEVLQEGADG